MVSMTNRTLPLSPSNPTMPEHSNESEDEYDDIEFDSDESDENVGVEDEARFHSYDEEQLVSIRLFQAPR